MPLQAELTQKWLGLDAALKTQIEGLLLSALATQVNHQVFKKKAPAPLLILFKDSRRVQPSKHTMRHIVSLQLLILGKSCSELSIQKVRSLVGICG